MVTIVLDPADGAENIRRPPRRGGRPRLRRRAGLALYCITAVGLAPLGLGCEGGSTDGADPPDQSPPDAGVSPDATAASLITWHAHIRPLVESHCLGCHNGQSASGLDLTDAEWVDFSPPWWAGAVVTAVIDGSMPPPLPDGACRPVVGRRPLESTQAQIFGRWREAGYPEGSPADYNPPTPRVTPDPGPSSLRLAPTTPYTPAFDGERDHRCLLLPWRAEGDVWLRGFAVPSEKARAMRRAELYVIEPLHTATVQALADGTPEPGYPCEGGPGVYGYRPLGVWLPGDDPFMLPADHGFHLVDGSRLVMRVEYGGWESGASESASSEPPALDMWLTDAPSYRVEAIELLHTALRIPAGQTVRQGRSFTMGSDGTLIGAWGRLGTRGAGLTVELNSTNADRCILNLPTTDPDWLGAWRFSRSDWLPIVPDDRVSLRCIHDDRGRVSGPDRRWGFEPEDERCDATLMIARPVGTVDFEPQCGLFEPCIRACADSPDGLDPACFARCHAVGQAQCVSCLLGRTEACSQRVCEAELRRVGECVSGCEDVSLACLVEGCLPPFAELTGCVEGALTSGACADVYDACGVDLLP